jgi:uncharacterized phage protein gp47/JayE
MVNWFAGLQSTITDFIPGGKTRTKLETVAVEMEWQDYQFEQALLAAIPESIYTAFSFDLLGPQPASCTVTFSTATPASSPIAIVSGTRVATDGGIVFATTAAATIATGTTSITVFVVAIAPGAIGNVQPGTINVLKSAISGVTAVTNALQATGGTDEETIGARQLRFMLYIATLTRGTAKALEFAALQGEYRTGLGGSIIEKVVQAKVADIPTTGPAGRASVYIYNGSGTASAGLIASAQSIINGYRDVGGNIVPGYKAAGVIVTVASVTVNPTNVTASIQCTRGGDPVSIRTAAIAAITGYLQIMTIGQPVILNEIIERIMAIPNVNDVALVLPVGNILTGSNEIATVGTVTITAEVVNA